MSMNAKAIVFMTAGFAAGALAAALSIGPPLIRRAAAQQPAPMIAPTGPRFQVSAWSMGTRAEYGAYIVDSWSGDVFLVKGTGSPVPIGRVRGVEMRANVPVEPQPIPPPDAPQP